VDVDTLRLLQGETGKDSLFQQERLLQGSVLPRYTQGLFDTTDSSYYGRRVTVLSFEELVQTPLFREYLRIPLFRQFLERYPVVFRHYVESVLFQQFWTVPAFEQYFRNPVLFYKYIVPQVQIFAQTTEEVFPDIYGRKTYDYTNTVGQKDVLVGDYLNKIFGQVYGYGYNTIDRSSVYGENTGIFGQKYGQGYGHGYNTRYGQGYNNIFAGQSTNYKYILDKIYRTLFVDTPRVGEITQVKTDVKLAPTVQREVVVDQVTGEKKVVLVEEPKVNCKIKAGLSHIPLAVP
jgi:hypothetical protein